jgi:hypothetical protein
MCITDGVLVCGNEQNLSEYFARGMHEDMFCPTCLVCWIGSALLVSRTRVCLGSIDKYACVALETESQQALQTLRQVRGTLRPPLPVGQQLHRHP